MTRQETIKRFKNALENLGYTINISSKLFNQLCDELDRKLGDNDYPSLDGIDIEYITGA